MVWIASSRHLPGGLLRVVLGDPGDIGPEGAQARIPLPRLYPKVAHSGLKTSPGCDMIPSLYVTCYHSNEMIVTPRRGYQVSNQS